MTVDKITAQHLSKCHQTSNTIHKSQKTHHHKTAPFTKFWWESGMPHRRLASWSHGWFAIWHDNLLFFNKTANLDGFLVYTCLDIGMRVQRVSNCWLPQLPQWNCQCHALFVWGKAWSSRTSCKSRSHVQLQFFWPRAWNRWWEFYQAWYLYGSTNNIDLPDMSFEDGLIRACLSPWGIVVCIMRHA